MNRAPALIALLVAGALNVAQASLPTVLTLEAAINRALANNPELQALVQSLESREIAIELAGSRFQFTLTPQTSFTRGEDSQTDIFGLSLVRETIFGTRAELLTQAITVRPDSVGTNLYRDRVALQLDQPLLRAIHPRVNREPIAQAEDQWAALRRQVELRRTDLVLRVVEVYEDLIRTQRELEFQQTTQEQRRRQYRLTQLRERQGKATRADVLQAELRVSEAGLRHARLAENLVLLQSDLLQLMGDSALTAFAAQPAPLPDLPVCDPTSGLRIALSHRLDYAQLLADARAAARGLSVARLGLLPELNLQTRYEQFGEGDSAAAAARLEEGVWFAGLSFSVDLPQRDNRLAVRSAGVTTEVLALQQQALRTSIERQVVQSCATYTRTRQEIGVAEKNFKLAQIRARSLRRLFEQGRVDTFAMTDAEDELKRIEIEWLTAQSGTAVAAYRLQRTLGTLLESPAELLPPAPEGSPL